jgi:hypothetical protein
MARLTKILEKAVGKPSPRNSEVSPPDEMQQEILEKVVRAIEIRRKLIDLSSFQVPKDSQE